MRENIADAKYLVKWNKKKGAIQLNGRIYVKGDITVFTGLPKVIGKDLMLLRIELRISLLLSYSLS